MTGIPIAITIHTFRLWMLVLCPEVNPVRINLDLYFQLAKRACTAADGHVPLLRVLFKAYGRPFFAFGIIKFVADCCGFASPILLSKVVSFMGDPDADTR